MAAVDSHLSSSSSSRINHRGVSRHSGAKNRTAESESVRLLVPPEDAPATSEIFPRCPEKGRELQQEHVEGKKWIQTFHRCPSTNDSGNKIDADERLIWVFLVV